MGALPPPVSIALVRSILALILPVHTAFTELTIAQDFALAPRAGSVEVRNAFSFDL